MRECRFSLSRVLSGKDRIVDYVGIRENTGHWKPVFSHVQWLAYFSLWQLILRRSKPLSLWAPTPQNGGIWPGSSLWCRVFCINAKYFVLIFRKSFDANMIVYFGPREKEEMHTHMKWREFQKQDFMMGQLK